MTRRPTHIAFSDESCWNTGRYRSISVASMPTEHHSEVEGTLERVFRQNRSREMEFKWSSRWSFVKVELATALVDTVLGDLREQLRIDTIIWDTQDVRHRSIAVDDGANFEIMYFQVSKHVLRRWGGSAVWALRPDRQRDLDREMLDRALTGVVSRLRQLPNQDSGAPRISSVTSVDSRQHRTIQIADLFSGLSAFSWKHGNEYRRWRTSTTGVPKLFAVETPEPTWTARGELRHRVLDHVWRRVGRSLKPDSLGLETANPLSPINFWLSRPQHHRDKAPFRGPGGQIVRARDRDRGQASRMARRVG